MRISKFSKYSDKTFPPCTTVHYSLWNEFVINILQIKFTWRRYLVFRIKDGKKGTINKPKRARQDN